MKNETIFLMVISAWAILLVLILNPKFFVKFWDVITDIFFNIVYLLPFLFALIFISCLLIYFFVEEILKVKIIKIKAKKSYTDKKRIHCSPALFLGI